MKPNQAHKECSNRFYIWDLPSLLRSSCASPCTPLSAGTPLPSQVTAALPCQGSPGPSATKPHPTGSWTCTTLANISWVTETEEQNWTSNRRTCNRKFLSNKHGKLDKKHLGLRTKAAIVHRGGNSNLLGAAVSFRPWTAGHEDRKGKHTENSSSIVLPWFGDEEKVPKAAGIIPDAFNASLSLQNSPGAVRPAAPTVGQGMCEQLPQLPRARHQAESLLSPWSCFTAKL